MIYATPGKVPCKRTLAAALAAGMLTMLGGCASPTACTGGATAIAQASDAADPYRLGVGDRIAVSVFGQDNLGGTFEVGQTGELTLPLIGAVPAAGRTPAELSAAITQRLAQGLVRFPEVAVNIASYRPVNVLGEVNRPGQYGFVPGTTAVDAVAAAGGYTYRANTRRAFVVRRAAAAETALPLLCGLRLNPGDTLRIGERIF